MWGLCLAIAANLVISQGQQPLANQRCRALKNWRCKEVADCPVTWIFDALGMGMRPLICDSSGESMFVCCPVSDKSVTPKPTRPPPTRSISQRKCVEYARYIDWKRTCIGGKQTLIVGGTTAAPKEFPHMALVGYGTDQKRINWACGGSLISENFVLSAAHCSNPVGLGPASWVRLGDLTLDTDLDDATPITLKISQRIVHPHYTPSLIYNDISLFRLERRVDLSPYIRPICLPDNRTLPRSAVATGWGHTEFGGTGSKDLLKVDLPFISNKQCNDIYDTSMRYPQGIRGDSQICAGGDGKDTCQIGITSYGRICGVYPGVYTKVSKYVSWIEQKVWPNQ